MLKQLLPIVFYLAPNLLAAQPPALDSLLDVQFHQEGEARVKTRLAIVRYHDLPDNGSILLADSVFLEAKELELHEIAAEALLTQGHIWFSMEEFDRAETSYRRALRYALDHEVVEKVSKAHGAIAGVYEAENVPDSALIWSETDVEYLQRTDSLNQLLEAFDRLSYYQSKYQRIVPAYQTQRRVLDLARSSGDTAAAVSAMIQIATVMGRQLDLEGARDRFVEALRQAERHDYKDLQVIGLSNLGLLEKKEGAYKAADSLYQLALSIVPGIRPHYQRHYFNATIYSNLATLYREKGSFRQAVDFGKRSADLAEQENLFNLMATSFVDIAYAYVEVGKLDSAKYYLQQAGEYLSRQHNALEYSRYLEARAAWEQASGQLEAAIASLHDWVDLKDSLKRVEQDTRISFAQAEFESREKELEISRLEEKQQMANKSRNLWIVLFVVMALMAAVVIVAVSYRARKQKELLLKSREVEQMKSRFFANISHEFRTPLTLILGPVSTLLEKAEGDDRRLLLLIRNKAKGLLKLINQIMELARFEATEVRLRATRQNLVPLLRRQVMAFESQAARLGIDLSFEANNASLDAYVQAEYIEIMISNLVGNAMKFTSAGGEISVTAAEENSDWIRICIRDTGKGIPPAQLRHIFDRFFQVEQTALGGTGIGLSLTRDLVNLHGGKILVESTVGEGTTFTLLLPADKTNLSNGQMPAESQSEELVRDHQEEVLALEQEEERPLILVVEDQIDMQDYLLKELSLYYRVAGASDGLQGLSQARALIPDLILTDMMMPELGGIDMVRELKQDPATDHVPVIMLTARSEQADVIGALESRVDEYLLKPFEPRELVLRIRNLLELRNNIRQLRSSYIPGKVKETPEYSPSEQKFLDAIHKILLQHLDSPDLDVNLLAGAVHLSRSQLFRKLRAITGEAPSTYIRHFRLRQAMELLRKQETSVTEVAYLVGFSSPTYFSKCFSDYFGQPPVEIYKSASESGL